jgi:putative membrane protein
MGDWSWGGWLLMTATVVAFWAFVAWVVVVMIRASRPPAAHAPDPERILAERFAVGEIDDDEYCRRLDALRGAGKAS